MATPSFYITNCTVADGDALGRNNMSAFWGDPNWRYVWKHTTLPHVIDAAAARGAHNLLRDRQVLRHFKCVDEATGQLVGYVRWKLPWTRYQHTKEGERNGGDEDKDNNRGSGPVSLLLWPEGQTPEVSDEERARIEERAAGAQWNPNATEPNDRIDEPLTARKRELMATKEYLRKSMLDYIAVHPEHQGKGYATALVQHGIQKARELGMDIFVLAFVGGFRLYTNAGFVELDRIVQDATSLGGTAHYECRMMEYVLNK